MINLIFHVLLSVLYCIHIVGLQLANEYLLGGCPWLTYGKST